MAAAFDVDPKTVRKWRARFLAEGEAGLADRSSRPHRSPTRLGEAAQGEILALRRQRLSGPAIARRLGRPVATVGLVLRRRGLGRLGALDPKPELVRYERERPGELIHIDIKKLGRIDGIGHRITGDRTRRARGIGWDFLHVCVDDASRLAYTEILPDERKASAVAFLERALAWFAGLGVTVERVMTDNGSAYRSHAFRQASPMPASSTSAPGPTRPGPTARPNASSRPACANGPTCKPSPARPSAPQPCGPGSTATTTTDPIQPSAASLPPPD